MQFVRSKEICYKVILPGGNHEIVHVHMLTNYITPDIIITIIAGLNPDSMICCISPFKKCIFVKNGLHFC